MNVNISDSYVLVYFLEISYGNIIKLYCVCIYYDYNLSYSCWLISIYNEI